jgi:hypothetical protein
LRNSPEGPAARPINFVIAGPRNRPKINGAQAHDSLFANEFWLLSAAMTIRTLIEDFANKLSSLMEGQALERARHAVESALGVGTPRRGRPPKNATGATAAVAILGRKKRKKGPKQLCPIPGCKNPAAPVFGMVCAKHKDVPKAQIKKYREARRAKKQKGKK